MSELEKMRRGELADMSSPELQDSFIHAKKNPCKAAHNEQL